MNRDIENNFTIDDLKRHYGSVEFPMAFFRDYGSQIKDGRLDWHWHREIEFTRINEGTVTCYVGPELIELKKGDMMFLNMNAIHRYDYSQDADMEIIAFAPEFIAPRESLIFRNLVQPFIISELKCVRITGGQKQRKALGEALDSLLREKDNGELHELKLHIETCRLWQSFLEHFSTWFSSGEEGTNLNSWQRLQTMLAFIHDHYGDSIRLEDIADSAGISKSEVLRCFRGMIRTTPMDYVTTYRIRRACHMLETSSHSITYIAEESGFSDPGYFSKTFKRRVGVSPKEYRKSHQ